jgi:transposase
LIGIIVLIHIPELRDVIKAAKIRKPKVLKVVGFVLLLLTHIGTRCKRALAGGKTALMLVVLTDGLDRFTSASELCNYAGLTPLTRQSGSSVKGRPRISKIGNQKLRNLLFMCSFTACKYNKACRDIYERIVAKGKSKKLALIAVCNKLLKQVFAIAKSGLTYDHTYRSTLVKN